MKEFQADLETISSVPKKHIPFYLQWVHKYSEFCRCRPESPEFSGHRKEILSRLSLELEEWQVKQAEQSIQLFLYFHSKSPRQRQQEAQATDAEWKLAADKMVRALRLKHRALSTEKQYLAGFGLFTNLSAVNLSVN